MHNYIIAGQRSQAKEGHYYSQQSINSQPILAVLQWIGHQENAGEKRHAK